MRLLSPQEVSEITGLPYRKALELIKQMNYIQINNRYYIFEDVLKGLLNLDEPILITTTLQED